jgi:hypothetical protein
MTGKTPDPNQQRREIPKRNKPSQPNQISISEHQYACNKRNEKSKHNGQR